MSSVTQRIHEIKQPFGGYVKPSQFQKISFDDQINLHNKENIHASIVGLAVDYLARFMTGTNKNEAFKISLQGAVLAQALGVDNAANTALSLLKNITQLDSTSIINACKLVSFDSWYRNSDTAAKIPSYNEIWPNDATVHNIQTMVQRSIDFAQSYGPIIQDGFNFAPQIPCETEYLKMLKTGEGLYGGYTPTVCTGDGDFLTKDTLWDFKVSKSRPTSKHTLQLLMYWIMGQHSGQDVYKNITKIGIFNPRLNEMYLLEVNKIPRNIIRTIETNVIGY